MLLVILWVVCTLQLFACPFLRYVVFNINFCAYTNSHLANTHIYIFIFIKFLPQKNFRQNLIKTQFFFTFIYLFIFYFSLSVCGCVCVCGVCVCMCVCVLCVCVWIGKTTIITISMYISSSSSVSFHCYFWRRFWWKFSTVKSHPYVRVCVCVCVCVKC